MEVELIGHHVTELFRTECCWPDGRGLLPVCQWLPRLGVVRPSVRTWRPRRGRRSRGPVRRRWRRSWAGPVRGGLV